MGQKTIFVSEAERETWDRLGRYAAFYGVSRSSLLLRAGREWLTMQEAAGNGPKGAVEAHKVRRTLRTGSKAV